MSLTMHWQRAMNGESITFRPRGNSMAGLVPNGALVEVQPWCPEELKIGDVVLAKVKGSIYLHKITAIDGQRFQIGNNKGGINGWTSGDKIAGKCVSVNGAPRP